MLEKLSLDGKVVVVTGGGTGLGREMGRHLALAGADIVVAGRRAGPIEEAAEEFQSLGCRALAISTDVTDSAQVNALFERALGEFGHVDVLVNNAGGGGGGKALWDITDEDWRIGIDTNLTGAFYCCRAIMKHMVERGSGRIINVSSGQGLRGQRGSFMYGCAKGGIIQLTRVLAATHGSDGITSTCIVPGMIPTRQRVGDDDTPNRRLGFLPMGRPGTPEEIAPLAVYLASDASDYMNGEMFYCDGGAMAGGAATTGYAPLIPLQD